jgi:glycosyltransferase involved in cell wall biosynthesis
MMPLISVLMPVFNAADTLPLALASLQAQTHRNWECIVIDDGSADDPSTVVDKVGDPRIRFHRQGRNRGRGYARQLALEMARGKYVAFLDGDDWICPTKLRRQVDVLTQNPEIVVVSTGMAILNMSGELAGVRHSDSAPAERGTVLRRPAMPPLAFPPCMMATDLAKETGFDASFPTAEDVDFLLRALLGKRYAVLPAPLYMYREQGSMTLNKVSAALDHCCRMFMKHFDQHAGDCALEIAKARGKQGLYHAAAALGLWDKVIALRSRPASATECQRFQDAWTIVTNTAQGGICQSQN